MLTNYFKLAWRVLGRNKLYTFISLFGISFTLMVLMLSTAFINNEFGANPPLTEMDRMVLITHMQMRGWQTETTTTIDSTYNDGQLQIDTTITEKKLVGQPSQTSNSGVGYDFFKDRLQHMKEPAIISMFNPGGQLDVFQNGKKMILATAYTDDDYWEIFDFDFLEGRPFSEDVVSDRGFVCILTEKTAREYFGARNSYLGEAVIYRSSAFEVIGVVADAHTSVDAVSADIFVPYTHMADANLNYGFGLFGELQVALLAPSEAAVEAVVQELRNIEETQDMGEFDDFDELKMRDGPILEHYARQIIQAEENNAKTLRWIIIIGLLLFIIIPTINLINLNITRIMERSAEIGVRKSFGARTRDLMLQFLFENIVLTFIGGIIGFLLTLLVMQLLNGSSLLGKSVLAINPQVFVICFFIILVFGIVSGLLPAWRTSRTPIANAIKTNAI